MELEKNDQVLMCSDGLTNMVEDKDIGEIILGQSSLESQVITLINTANRNGGRDNITVIIIRPFSDEVKEC